MNSTFLHLRFGRLEGKIMFRFLEKKRNNVVAPVSGKCIPIEEIPDEVFSTKMLGDGFAVQPDGETVVAPMAGKIVMLPETNHAFGLKTKNGVEILVHIGVETVGLNGKGFTALLKQGNHVEAGTPVIHFDREFLRSEGIDAVTITVFTGGYDHSINLECYYKNVKTGDVIIENLAT